MRSTNSKGAPGASTRSKGEGTTVGDRTTGRPTKHPNVIPWFWSRSIPRHGHWFVVRNSNHIPGWWGRHKPPHSKHPTSTSDMYLNSRLHATHDGDTTRLHNPVLPTTSCVTNFPFTIPLWSCTCRPQQWHRWPTRVPPPYQASKIQGHVK